MPHEPREYIRENGGQHVCPDGPASTPHYLIPKPGRCEGSRLWVCPIELDAALDRARREIEAQRAHEAREIRAAQIAADVLATYAENLYPDESAEFMSNAAQWRDLITEAALSGLTEKEGAR